MTCLLLQIIVSRALLVPQWFLAKYNFTGTPLTNYMNRRKIQLLSIDGTILPIDQSQAMIVG
jgi:hypothetical protein